MRNLFIFLVLGTALSINAQTKSSRKSPPLSEASPGSVGMSAERLTRIDAMCREAIANGEVPGLVALVARHGKIVYYKAFGTADNPAARGLKRDDIFRIASQSKAITAKAVMMLWEQGRFRLDDPISTYIPEFKDPQVLSWFQYKDTTYSTVPATSEITIRLTTEEITIAESVRELASLPLHHNPGEKFTYSEGLDVLGYFIELVSGMPFDEYLRKHLFDPLGMNDTWFYLPPDIADRLVPVQYQNDQGEWVRFPITFYDPDYPVKGARTFFSGGAGLSCSAKDYALFLQMYLNGGELNGVRILSRTTVGGPICG